MMEKKEAEKEKSKNDGGIMTTTIQLGNVEILKIRLLAEIRDLLKELKEKICNG